MDLVTSTYNMGMNLNVWMESHPAEVGCCEGKMMELETVCYVCGS